MPDIKSFYAFRHTLEYRVALQCNRIAWIDYHKGQHELFVQDLPDGLRRSVLNSEGDDGQPLHIHDLSPSGRYLAVSHGETSAGVPCPNPRQSIDPPEGQLQVFDLSQPQPSALFTLNPAPFASITPDESALCWSEKGTVCQQLFTEKIPRNLFTVQGYISALSWSPDNQYLAFICQREERSLLGLYRKGSHQIQWVSPDFDRDQEPCWSPDSKHLAFIRFKGPEMDVAERLFSDLADSFSVMLMDMATQHVRAVWTGCQEITAGLSLQDGLRPLHWAGSDRLLFSHDNTGWDHLYQYNLHDNSASSLTEGPWLVQDYTTSLDGSILVYSHNRKRRHHYTLDMMTSYAEKSGTGKNTRTPLQVPSESQFWQPAVSFDNRFIICLTSAWNTPCHLTCYDQKTEILINLCDTRAYNDGVSHHFIKPQTDSFQARDSQTFQGQVFIPSGSGPFPAILNIHGGPAVQSLPGFHLQLGMSYQYAFCQLLANCGFLILDINYRGSSGYGKLFRQAPERGWDGANDYRDILAAGQWLSRQKMVDRRRIGVMGKAWGGYLSAMALAHDSSLFRAGVVINGCHNFPRELRKSHWNSLLFNCHEGEHATEGIARAKIAEESSPWGCLEHWMSPVLLVHGDDDRRVSFAESLHLAHALRSQSVEVESLALPGESHEFLLHESWLKIGSRALAFLQRYLQT